MLHKPPGHAAQATETDPHCSGCRCPGGRTVKTACLIGVFLLLVYANLELEVIESIQGPDHH
jgi:hypothetical protein